MATGRKGSTSKGGVRFPDDDEPPGSPTRRDDQSNLSSLIAVLEKDGSYLVKAGFLKSHHCYEIIFTVPDVPTVGKELSCLPSCSPSRKPQRLRIQRINSTLDGVKVLCEYRTHQEGVLQEEITLVTKGRRDSSLKVRLQAKVIVPSESSTKRLQQRQKKEREAPMYNCARSAGLHGRMAKQNPHHGTPMLLEGVRCLGSQRDFLTRHGSDRKRI